MAQAFIEHVNVSVSDVERTARMLMDLFGWRVIRELPSPAPGVRLVFIGDGHGGALEVYTAEGPPLAHPAHLAFAVPLAQFAALEERLRAAATQLAAIGTLAACPSGSRIRSPC